MSRRRWNAERASTPSAWKRRTRGATHPEAPPTFPDAWLQPEPYPGASAMDDVRGAAPGVGGRAAAAAARLAVVQLALGAATGAITPDELEEARAVAAAYVRGGGLRPAEAAALGAAAFTAGPEPSPDVPVALGLAAASASADGQAGGASSLWRAAYALATRWGHHEQAARAAEALAVLARAGGSASSAGSWRRRARRHARRVASGPMPA